MRLMKSMLLVIGLCSAGVTASSQQTQTSTLPGKKKDAVILEKVKIEHFTEFSREVPAEPGSVLKIKNSRYNLEIRLWDEKKVKIVSSIATAEDTTRLTDEQRYALSGITLNAFGKR